MFKPLPPNLPIDRDATLETFGYLAASLAPTSTKHVICRCGRCENPFPKARGRVTPATVCPSCAHAKDGKIPKDRRGAGKVKAVFVCKGCGNKYEGRVAYQADEPRCPRCRCLKTWELRAPIETKPGAASLLEAETLAKFGYSALALTPRAFDKVVAQCSKCPEKFERIRRNVVDEPVCNACSYADRITVEAVEKRRETLLSRYGTTGMTVPPGSYGKTEDEIARLVEAWTSTPVIRQKALSGGKSIDIYLPEKRIAIEYCGLFWHNEASPTARGRNYHAGKMLEVASQGDRLITIFEDEWRTRRSQAEGFLRAQLGSFDRRVGAREGVVSAVSLEVAREFLGAQHIQGPAKNSKLAWGFHAEGELLAVMTFGPHHRQGHRDVYVLDRFAVLSGVNIPGGASKLLSAATPVLREHGVSKLVSWSDNRWSAGVLYGRLGFLLAEDLPPDYSYVKTVKPKVRLSKQSQRKDRAGCPEGKTEGQWAAERGLARIWDCGKKRWELTFTV